MGRSGFHLVLYLIVTNPLVTLFMGISGPSIFGKVCFDMLKSIEFGYLLRLFSSFRHSDRIFECLATRLECFGTSFARAL